MQVRVISFIFLCLLILTGCTAFKPTVRINEPHYNKSSGSIDNSKSLILSTHYRGSRRFKNYLPEILKTIKTKMHGQGFSFVDPGNCDSCGSLIVAFKTFVEGIKYYPEFMRSLPLTPEDEPAAIGTVFTLHLLLVDHNEDPIFYISLMGVPPGESKFIKAERAQEKVDKMTLDEFNNYWVPMVFFGEIIESALGQSNKTVYKFFIDVMTNDSLSLAHRGNALYLFHNFVVGKKVFGLYDVSHLKKYDGYTFMFSEDEMKNSQGLEAMYSAINALKTKEPDAINKYRESIEKLKNIQHKNKID